MAGWSFTVVTGATDRESACGAMSRGRHTNTLHLAVPEPDDQQYALLTHLKGRDPSNALVAGR